jgi:hypothetical protein
MTSLEMLQLQDAHERSEMQVRSLGMRRAVGMESCLGHHLKFSASHCSRQNSVPLTCMCLGRTVCKITDPSGLKDSNVSLFSRVYSQGARGLTIGRI